ncbi:MAG: hypothetical protein ACLFNO_03525 [Parcubacteria group bacterium]
MTIKSFTNLIKKEAGTLALILAILLAINAIITFSQPLRYEASNKLLIQQDVSKFDPYNVFKVNEYYNNLIKEIIHSESFYQQVLNSDYNIDASYFKDTRREQIKTWEKTVDIVSTDIGTLKIKTYHTDTKEAEEILLAITDILVNKNSQYQNLDNNIDIKIINQTTVSNYPTKPNIVLNFAYTIVIAILISLLYIYYKSEKEYQDIDKNNNYNYNDMIIKNTEKNEKDEKGEIINNKEKENKEDISNKKINTRNENDDKQVNDNENIEKNIEEGEEINLEEELEKEANINNLFNK